MLASSYPEIATLAEAYCKQREELLDLLLSDAILRRTPTQPVLARDGTSARWMLDSLSLTLRGRGAELAADCLLQLLENFEGRQLATFGITGIPLLQSIIIRSKNRYSGLLIRKEIKAHGSMRRIEGKPDITEPVVVIDDSISSGLSMEAACEYLEQAGLRVEGGVVLVSFGWENGYARMQQRGYHVEAVYDVWRDLMPRIAGEPHLLSNPTKTFDDLSWSCERARNGLHPALLAREALIELFRTGELPRPPSCLDDEYDSRGGVWISIRDRDDIHLRYAREGFWQFPGETAWSSAEGVLRAAWLVFQDLTRRGVTLDIIHRGVLAVTFFDELHETAIQGLDNDRYGIVVCSRERPASMGGALPRMPGIQNEWQQYVHAAYKNAGLKKHEPYRIFRHEVRKAVEPGVKWQTSGVGVSQQRVRRWHKFLPSIAGWARTIAISQILDQELPSKPDFDGFNPEELDWLYVTVYYAGKLRGCAGSAVISLEEDLQILVKTALADDRFEPLADPPDPHLLAVSVSCLFDALLLGEMTPLEVSTRYRLADQALAARSGDRFGILLPFVATTHNLGRIQFAEEVLRKADIAEPPFEWVRYDCTTWLADKNGCDPLSSGFRASASNSSFERNVRELIAWHCEYLTRVQRPDGAFYFIYAPFQNYRYLGGGLPRSAHAAWVLARAADLLKRSDLRSAAERALDFHLALADAESGKMWLKSAEENASVSELAFTLLALLQLPTRQARHDLASSIARTLWSQIDIHGRMITHRDMCGISDEYQDYFPGQAMLALAHAASNEDASAISDKLQCVLRYYRHRFRYKHDFGQVSWWMQAAHRWWEVTRLDRWRDFAFEIGDWILQFQLEKNGGFVTDQQSDGPGYTTALYLEGLSAGLAFARRVNDDARASKYWHACQKGFEFLRSLTIRPEHESVLPNATYAIGGLRADLMSSEIRTDFVQHSLSAALELLPQFELVQKGEQT